MCDEMKVALAMSLPLKDLTYCQFGAHVSARTGEEGAQ
jgi:hypothetical protein